MNEKTKKVIAISGLFSTMGLLLGLIIAYRKDAKFWGYIGNGLLFMVMGSLIGSVGSTILIKDK